MKLEFLIKTSQGARMQCIEIKRSITFNDYLVSIQGSQFIVMDDGEAINMRYIISIQEMPEENEEKD